MDPQVKEHQKSPGTYIDKSICCDTALMTQGLTALFSRGV